MDNKELVKKFCSEEFQDIGHTLALLSAQHTYLSNIIKNCQEAKECKDCCFYWEDGEDRNCAIVNSEGLEGEL